MQDPRYDGLEQRVRKLEQHTEPITIPRIELDPGGIQSRLDNQAELLKEVVERQDHLDDLAVRTFNEVAKANTEIGVIKTTLERMDKRFDAIAEVQKLILERLPEKGK